MSKHEITVYAPPEVVAAIDRHHRRCEALGLRLPRSVAADALCRLGLSQVCEPVPRGEDFRRSTVYVGGDVEAAIRESGATATAAVCGMILAGDTVAEVIAEEEGSR